MLNFPSNPSINQTFSPTETTWKWDGQAWNIQQPSINISGDATGISIGNTIAVTLSTKITAGTYGNFTVDSAGRITAARNLNSGDVTTALGFTPFNSNGGTLSGPLILNSNPTQDLQAATKEYVDRKAFFALAVGIY